MKELCIFDFKRHNPEGQEGHFHINITRLYRSALVEPRPEYGMIFNFLRPTVPGLINRTRMISYSTKRCDARGDQHSLIRVINANSKCKCITIPAISQKHPRTPAGVGPAHIWDILGWYRRACCILIISFLAAVSTIIGLFCSQKISLHTNLVNGNVLSHYKIQCSFCFKVYADLEG